MFTGVRICTQIYIYICIYVYKDAFSYICAYVFTPFQHKHKHMRTHMHTFLSASSLNCISAKVLYVCACVKTLICVSIYIYIYYTLLCYTILYITVLYYTILHYTIRNIHTYIHAHIHTYRHMYIFFFNKPASTTHRLYKLSQDLAIAASGTRQEPHRTFHLLTVARCITAIERMPPGERLTQPGTRFDEKT